MWYISIHAARVGCDQHHIRNQICQNYFNPRSPSGLRLDTFRVLESVCRFQSTQPEWAATLVRRDHRVNVVFQSTQPEWAATKYAKVCLDYVNNFNPRSPSGLRQLSAKKILLPFRFQSTQPEWAATNGAGNHLVALLYFNPRSPSGLRPTKRRNKRNDRQISIHAARVGCDKCGRSYREYTKDFNPRSPSGLRPWSLIL